MTRRKASQVLSAGPVLLIRKSQAAATPLEIAKGPFTATRDSLGRYRVPEWFRDAKLGLWAHWGPQSAPEQGDWYARNTYLEGSPLYQWHLQHFGHPSKVGYKDVIPTFKAENFEPERLMDLYVKAGAKYFVSMGVHHDNFDLWNSKYQPRWNAVAAGPRKDIVGIWREAARKRGLKLGVSEHLSNSFDWFASAHRSDKMGPYAGVPYDGTDPGYADLYHSDQGMPVDFAQTAAQMGRVAPDSWKLEYFNGLKTALPSTNPIYCKPMAQYHLKSTGSASWRIITTSAPNATAGASTQSTPASGEKMAPRAHARSISSAASSTGSGRNPGRPIRASGTGTTSATSPTNLQKSWSTCWWIS